MLDHLGKNKCETCLKYLTAIVKLVPPSATTVHRAMYDSSLELICLV